MKMKRLRLEFFESSSSYNKAGELNREIDIWLEENPENYIQDVEFIKLDKFNSSLMCCVKYFKIDVSNKKLITEK